MVGFADAVAVSDETETLYRSAVAVIVGQRQVVDPVQQPRARLLGQLFFKTRDGHVSFFKPVDGVQAEPLHRFLRFPIE